MKRSKGNSRRIILAASAALALAGGQWGHAATGTWTATTGSPQSWGTTGDWSGGTIADGATYTANLTANIGGAYTINLDISRSIGTLNIGDSTATVYAYTLATGSNTLTLDNGAAAAAIAQSSTGSGDTISGKLAIAGNGTLNVTVGNTYAATLTLSAGITSVLSSGTQTLSVNSGSITGTTVLSGIIGDGVTGGHIAITKSGASSLTLSGNNAFTGGVSLGAGTLNINNASALGTGTLTITGGTINNSTASAIINSNNNVQAWNGSFSFGGTRALDLGTGSVTLGANIVATVGGSSASALTVGGAIGGTGKSLAKTGNGTLILTNAANAYTGGTTISGGVLQFSNTGAIAGSGQNVTVNYGGTAGFGYALDQTTLTSRIAAGSKGTVALALDSSNNLDFSVAGLENLSLGAAGGSYTFSGALTPGSNTYRLGGGGGTLTFNSTLTGANSLVVGGGGSGGSVTLVNPGSYSGPTSVSGGIGGVSIGATGGQALLQTNILSGTSTTPFGSNLAISLNNGALGLGTAGTLGANDVMAINGYDVSFTGANSINLKAGTGGTSNVTLAANSLTRGTAGVLILNPTSGATLGNSVGASPSERVTVASASPTVINGMVAPYYVDGTTKNFLTYDATNGLKDIVPDKTGSNAMPAAVLTDNVLINETGNSTTIASFGNLAINSLRVVNTNSNNGTQTLGVASDTLTLVSGGLITNWSAGSGNTFSGATINFGTKEGIVGLYGVSGGMSFSSLIIGTGGFTTYGTHSLTVSNLQTTGGINIAGGSTLLNSGNGVISFNPNNVVTIAKGGTLGSNANNRPAQMLGLAGEGAVLWTSAVGATNSGSNTYTVDGMMGTGTSTFGGIIQDASGLGYTLGFTKTGLNTQVLTGASNYGGATTVSGGTLRLDFSGTNAPSTNILNNLTNSSALALGGGKLDIVGAAGASNSQQFNGLTVGAGNSSISASSGTGGITNVTLGGTLTRSVGGTVNFDLPASGTVSTTATTYLGNGVLVGGSATGPAFATVNGTDWAKVAGGTIGALASYDTNDFSASTKNTDVTYSLAPPAFTVNTLRFNTAGTYLTLTAGNTIGTGGILVTSATLGAGNGATITGGTNIKPGAGNEVVIINNGQLTVSSVIADGSAASALTLSGSGTTTLNGANSITGNVYLNSGTLVMGTGGVLSSTGTFFLNGGTLASSGGSIGATKAVTLYTNSTIGGSGNLTIGGTFTNNRNYNTLTVNNTGNTTLSGGLTLGAGFLFNVAGSGNITASGVLSTSGGLNYAGTGTMTLSNAANTYTGVTKVSSGTLSVGTLANGAANSSIGASTNVAANVVLDGGTLKYTGATVTTDRLFSVGASGGTLDASGTGAVTFSNVGSMGFNNTPGTRTLTLTGTNTGNNTLAAIVSDHLGLYATSLNKQGSGTWVLTGTNTYTGATSITGGNLIVNGSIANSAVTISGSGLLGGSGTTGAVAITGGTLAPGNSPGTLTMGSLAMDASTVLSYDLSASDHTTGANINDYTIVNGNLTLDGTINLTSLTELTVGTYTLMHYTGSLTDNGLLVGSNFGTASNQQYAISNDAAAGNINLVVTIPEPATATLLFGVASLGMLARRRRVAR